MKVKSFGCDCPRMFIQILFMKATCVYVNLRSIRLFFRCSPRVFDERG